MLKKVPYDAVTDFEPITKLGTVALALIAEPVGPGDIQELLTYAKANPGKLTVRQWYQLVQYAGEMLKTLGGIDMLNVPYAAPRRRSLTFWRADLAGVCRHLTPCLRSRPAR